MSPQIPSWSNLKVFALGAIWASVAGLGIAAALLVDDLLRWSQYSDAIDWPQIWHMAAFGALTGARGYYLKHKALLQPPPGEDPEMRKSAVAGS